MRLVKGKARKSITMAELFNKDKGDLFIDYGKRAYSTQRMLYLENLFMMTDKEENIEVFIKAMSEYLEKSYSSYSESFSLFIDGNFRLEDVEELKSLEKHFPKMKLTVSVQTNEDGISLQEI